MLKYTGLLASSPNLFLNGIHWWVVIELWLCDHSQIKIMPRSKAFSWLANIMFLLQRSEIFLFSTVQTNSGATPVSYTIVTQNVISLGRDDGSRDVFSVLFQSSYSCKSSPINLRIYLSSEVQGNYYQIIIVVLLPNLFIRHQNIFTFPHQQLLTRYSKRN